jgi:hypothetical protein
MARMVRIFPRNSQALAMLPGYNATVLDIFAATDGIPTAMSAGTVTNEPPPAAAFMAPASNPARKTTAPSAELTMVEI